MTEPHLVFVYGSLLCGESNHGLLAGAEFLGAAVTRERYVMVDCGPYPAVVDVPDDEEAERTPIQGEVYRVNDAELARLDELEDAPRLYQRRRIPFVWDEPSTGGEAWLYFQPAIGRRPTIDSGDWRRR